MQLGLRPSAPTAAFRRADYARGIGYVVVLQLVEFVLAMPFIPRFGDTSPLGSFVTNLLLFVSLLNVVMGLGFLLSWVFNTPAPARRLRLLNEPRVSTPDSVAS